MDITDVSILHVITRSDWGGAPRIVKLLATGMKADVAVACGTGGRLIDKLQTEGVPVFEQPLLQSPPELVADTHAFIDLIRLLRRESFDLIHCHSTKAGILGRIAARIAGTPVVFTVHGWGFYNTRYKRSAPAVVCGEKALAQITDAVVCVSENEFVEGQNHGIIQRAESIVIYNGVPPRSVSANHLTLYDETNINPGTTIVGAIARLVPQKDPLSIIRVGEELKNRGHDIATVLIGEGPLFEECVQYIDQHDLNAYVLGFHEHAQELLFDFDIFLMPSRFEGFPLATLESLHAGVPVIAYDTGGVAEAVVNGETGFVVEGGDETQFVARAEQLLTNADLRREMGRRGRTLARKHYTSNRMIAEYEKIYRSVIDW